MCWSKNLSCFLLISSLSKGCSKEYNKCNSCTINSSLVEKKTYNKLQDMLILIGFYKV